MVSGFLLRCVCVWTGSPVCVSLCGRSFCRARGVCGQVHLCVSVAGPLVGCGVCVDGFTSVCVCVCVCVSLSLSLSLFLWQGPLSGVGCVWTGSPVCVSLCGRAFCRVRGVWTGSPVCVSLSFCDRAPCRVRGVCGRVHLCVSLCGRAFCQVRGV